MNTTNSSIKAAVLGVLLLQSSFLCAGSMADLDTLPLPILNGFYIGGNLGAGDFLNKEMHTVNAETHQLGAVNFIGGGLIGYDYAFMPWLHTALEFFGDGTEFNLEISRTPNTYTMSQRYDIGFRVLPTYFFTPQTSIHLIFGYVNGGFKINDNGRYGYINQSTNQSGFQTGLGFNNELAWNFSIRLDGIYNIYGAQNSIGSNSNGVYQTYSNTFSSFIGQVGLVYQFK